MTTKAKMPQEYIDNLKNRYAAWARQNEAVNTLVWDDLDRLLQKAQTEAYSNENYEAFSFLIMLEERFKKHADSLKAELQIVSG